jgi:4-hydroxy-tetrahydrodipicolinate synthase
MSTSNPARRLPLDGIITVLNTPFDEHDRVDLDSLAKNVESAIDAGVVGFLVPAMASEVGKLSDDERLEMVRAVVRQNDGRTEVIGGASAPSVDQRLDHVRRLTDLGCDGILVSLPWEGDADAYRRSVKQVADCRPPWLMIQDWDAGGYGVPVQLIADLFERIPCFASLKIEVVPAGVKYSAVRDATGGQLHLAGGWAVSQMIEGLDRGVNAFMPTGMHLIYCEIHRLYACGQREAAIDLFHRVLPVLAFANQHLDISIHFFKRLLWRQGLYPTARVREPILPFNRIHASCADVLIERVIALQQEIAQRKRA